MKILTDNRISCAAALLILLPFFFLISGSVLDPLSGNDKAFAALDGIAWKRFGNSMQLAAWDVLFSSGLALPVYWFWMHLRPSWRSGLIVVSIIPFTFPSFATASSWMMIGTWFDQGISTRVIWGAQGGFTSWLYTLPGCGLILALQDWTVLFLLLVLTARVTQTQVDAGRLYLSKTRMLWTVFIPAWKLPWLCATVLIASRALHHFEAASLLQISVYPTEIYTRLASLLQVKAALVLCLPYLATAACLLLLFLYSWKHLNLQGSESIQLSGRPWVSGFVAVSAVGLSILLPIGGFLLQTEGLEVLDQAARQGERLLNSLLYSLIGAVVIVTIGLFFSHPEKKRPTVLVVLFGVIFFMPGILLAAGVMELRSVLPFLIPAWIHRCFLIYAHVCHLGLVGFFAGRLIWQYYGIPQIEYQRLLRLDTRLSLPILYLPTLIQPALYAMVLIGLLIWKDVAKTILLHPPGGDTLTVYYFNQLHYGSDSRTAAAGLLLILVPVFCIGVGSWLLFIEKRRTGERA